MYQQQNQPDYLMDDYTDYSNNISNEAINLQPSPSTSVNAFNFLDTSLINKNSLTLQNSLNQNLNVLNQYSPKLFENNLSTSNTTSVLYSYTAASSPNMQLGMSAQSPDFISNNNVINQTNSKVLNINNQSAPQSLLNETIILNSTNDSNFIQLHNYSVEVYQSFKEQVDVLFLGNLSIQEQNQSIPQILEIVKSILMPALEAEKDYLMNDVLCNWAMKQQKLSIATLWTQQIHYNLLFSIDTQFEYFGELLVQTLDGLQYLCDFYPKLGFENLFSHVRHISHLFLFYSIVVARQPPAVVVKCGEAENHRRSRFWFNTEIRILGGRAFGLHKTTENVQIKCFLITDETAKKLRTNAYHDVNENEHFIIEPNVSTFQTSLTVNLSSQTIFAAKFDDMKVSKKEQLRREEVWKKRYNLCYNIHISTNFQIELIGKKVSLPFAILVGPKCDVEAKLFLERSFADFIQKPEIEPPSLVNCLEMVNALEMKFQSIVETPQKSIEQFTLTQPHYFLTQSKQHLIKRLKADSNGMIFLDNFLKMPVAEEYCIKRGNNSINNFLNTSTTFLSSKKSSYTGSIVNNSNIEAGEWKLVPFFEWFFKLAELVSKHFTQLWNDGHIFGFCSKDEAEFLLSECHHPTLLIRFSDIEFAKIKISVRDKTGAIRHHWYETQDFQNRSLTEELLNNTKFRDIEYIYPNKSLEIVLGSRRKSNLSAIDRIRKPRSLQPSPIYFNNQEPATRL